MLQFFLSLIVGFFALAPPVFAADNEVVLLQDCGEIYSLDAHEDVANRVRVSTTILGELSQAVVNTRFARRCATSAFIAQKEREVFVFRRYYRPMLS